MKQEYKYKVQELGPKAVSLLEGEDRALVNTYYLDVVSPFNPDESRLDVNIYDLEDNLLESYQDVSDYSIRGVEQGQPKVNQLEVDPTVFMQDRTFLGDIVVEYRAFDNAFSRNAELFIWQLSSDRTEVRAKSLTISVQDLRYYTNLLQNRLNAESYFQGAYLEVNGIQIPVLNIITEVVEGETIVTLKLYKPLPVDVALKSKFQVLESLGEASRFRVSRELVVIEEDIPSLKGPNFEAKVDTSTIVTDYKNYTELLSQKSWENSKELYTMFKDAIQHTSVDYEDFSDFIHFSSAFERLENARYKFEKIFEYQADMEASQSLGKLDDVKKLKNLATGLIENFDHYENYLWFESGSAAWPKKLDPDTGTVARPFVNVDHPYEVNNEPGYLDWYNQIITLAEGYDNNNKDILISTIPAAIREDLDNNEPYLIFIHMIGQHFDDLWIYARAIADRYNGDNRLNFGISKELVKDALEAFGVDLYETNQNLSALFELCQPDGTYDWGEELEGYDWTEQGKKTFIRASEDPSWIEQPLVRENYTKRIYKRIYHNIPALLKMRGTSRGLRVLLNCFGIPNDILTFRVQGGTNIEDRPFFGPEEVVNIYDENVDETGLVGSPAGVKKVRTDNKNEPILEYKNVNGTGSFYRSSILSRYTTVTSSNTNYTDDSHKVEVGFDLNEAVNQFFQNNIDSTFTVDDVIGDPGNKEEQYGDMWKNLRESLLAGVILPEDGNTPAQRFRSPAAIIRLVRYFDSTFFRMLKDFLPARASINSGAIVKDNVLHRNRWKGVELSWTELTKSGSISGSSIYGSHGGSFRHAGYKFDTGQGGDYVSTGDRWQEKLALSGSREINGQLAGTTIKVTDGDLSKYNTHRKDSQPQNDFMYNFWFLDLPDPPLCRAKVTYKYLCEYWTFESIGLDTELQVYPILTISESGSLATVLEDKKKQHAFVEWNPGQKAEVAETHWKKNQAGPVFMGWYSSSADTSRFGTPTTPGRSLPLDPYMYGPKYEWKVYYENTDRRKILWTEQLRPDMDYHYYHYPDNDILIAWKLLDWNKNPKVDSTEPTESVITSLGGMQVMFEIESTEEGHEDELVYSLVIPEEAYFGTNNAYYWAQGLTDSGSVQRYGIQEMGGITGPYKLPDGTIVDATWFDSYEDWVGDWQWPITVASGSLLNEFTPNLEDDGWSKIQN